MNAVCTRPYILNFSMNEMSGKIHGLRICTLKLIPKDPPYNLMRIINSLGPEARITKLPEEKEMEIFPWEIPSRVWITPVGANDTFYRLQLLVSWLPVQSTY